MVSKRSQAGVTMMELLIVVTIVSIIAAIAYPSYTQFVVKSKRAAGSSTMLQIADRQQQYFMDNKQYATKLSSLGYSSESIMINDEGALVDTGDSRVTYSIALDDATTTSYTLVATPQKGQADNDTGCGSLTLTNAGAKGQTGTGNNCW